MAKDIRGFSKSYKDSGKDVKNMRREDLNDRDKQSYDSIRERAKQYEGKSEDQLLNELFKKVNDGKKNGTLSNADLDRFAGQVAPMLNPQQREKLNGLIKMIKS